MPSEPRLYRTGDLVPADFSSRRLRGLLASAEVVRVRPGVYVDGNAWRELTPEQRIVTRAKALTAASMTAPLFSHETAAALHGLPLYRPDERRTHVVTAPGRPGGARDVIRHRGVTDTDVAEVAGLPCTSVERTVADIARTATFERAVVVADAALRLRCVAGPGDYDAEAADAFRQSVLEIADRSAQGRTRAARALAFADGRAQLPGESISRIRLRALGFRRVDLQVAVGWPDGRPRYYVDFGLDDPGVRAFGEFDGDGKYVDSTVRAGRSTRQIVDDEKKREDWIRGRTQRRVARWNWTHLASPATLGRRLAEFGIVPPD